MEAPVELTTSGGGGTAQGPACILAASEGIELLDEDFGHPHRVGIHFCQASAALRRLGRRTKGTTWPPSARTARQLDMACARINALLQEAVSRALDTGHIVGVVGGEHSVALPAIEAHARRFGPLGVLQVDAHLDLREAYQGLAWSHASVMRNVLTTIPEVVRLVALGIRDQSFPERRFLRTVRDRVVVCSSRSLRDHQARGGSFETWAQAALQALPEQVYISFDIDGLDPSLCPGTGTPVPGGLSYPQAERLLVLLATSGRRILGFDLTEVAPGDDPLGWDGIVGSRLLYKLVGATLASRLTSLSAQT